jgi:hypothetical protein
MLAIRDPDGGPTPKRQVSLTSPRASSGAASRVAFEFWPMTHNTFEHSASISRGIGGGMGRITPEQNANGTLTVDIYDLKAKELACPGVGSDSLNGKNAQKNM